MKLIIIGIFSLTSFLAFAEMDLAKVKADMTANFDKRIADLNQAKSCVAAAATHDAIKQCHATLKAEHMEMRKEGLEKHEERLKERLKKIEEKKSQPGA